MEVVPACNNYLAKIGKFDKGAKRIPVNSDFLTNI